MREMTTNHLWSGSRQPVLSGIFVVAFLTSPAAGFTVAVRPSPHAEDVGDKRPRQGGPCCWRARTGVSSRRLGQHPIQFLLRSFRPALPAGNGHRPISATHFSGNQRVAALFRDQCPVRTTVIIAAAKFFQAMTAMGRVVVQTPVDLLGLERPVKSFQ